MREVKKANPGFKMSELCRVFEISCSSFYYKPIPNTLEIDVYEIKGKRNYKIYSNRPDELIPQ